MSLRDLPAILGESFSRNSVRGFVVWALAVVSLVAIWSTIAALIREPVGIGNPCKRMTLPCVQTAQHFERAWKYVRDTHGLIDLQPERAGDGFFRARIDSASDNLVLLRGQLQSDNAIFIPLYASVYAALAVWALGLVIWYGVDRSMARHALEAIAEDEDAAAAAGVNVTAEKLKITVLSALMTALAGALFCQYMMFISPDTVSGIGVSLQMVFAAVVGGLYVALGPTVGAVITILLAEILRIGFGTRAVGWDNLIYGLLLVLFIIFLPRGILGSILHAVRARR